MPTVTDVIFNIIKGNNDAHDNYAAFKTWHSNCCLLHLIKSFYLIKKTVPCLIKDESYSCDPREINISKMTLLNILIKVVSTTCEDEYSNYSCKHSINLICIYTFHKLTSTHMNFILWEIYFTQTHEYLIQCLSAFLSLTFNETLIREYVEK